MSYLADPPLDPIDIEGHILYSYVIACQGVRAITVDTPDPDFDFSLIVDSPALLRLKYTGAFPVEPTIKTVTLRMDFDDGTALHVINFRVLVEAPLLGRRVPNITTIRRLAVAPGAWVDFRILTDMPRCSATVTEQCVTSYTASEVGTGAQNLPGNLTINAFGRITGHAPTVPGWHVIYLRAASWHGNRYIRYFVLVVGNGGPPLDTSPPTFIDDGGGDPIIPPPPDTDPINYGTPPAPGQLYDGDYTTAQIAGMPEYEIPFKDDPKPYAYTMTYWQFLYNYEDIELGTAGPNGGIYVGLLPGSFKQIGGGVVEFKRQFAQNPPTRNEYESFIYDYHLVFFTFGLPNMCTQSTPLLVRSRIQYDYFATTDPDKEIWLPRAPKLLETCLGLVMRGEFPDTDTPSGEEVLAEDATYKIWKPGIYERKMRWVRWISSEDLIFNDA